MKLSTLLPALPILFITTSTYAADESTSVTDSGKLSGGAKLGFIYSNASTSSTSLNSGGWLKYEKEKWTNDFKASTYYTKSSDSEDDGTNKYSLSYKVSYQIAERYKAFIDNEYEHDQFETYRAVYSMTTGIERALIKTESSELNVGGGPGYRYSKRQTNDIDAPNQVSEDLIANAFINGKTKLTDSLSIGGDAEVDYGESNTTYTFGANLSNKLVGNVALVLDAQYIYNTEVASDKSNDEIYTTVSISYDF
ncbi:DUF481 domain-containing protein [Vibrio rumoiensis]|uniref:DUF481 domain-containing protein n=1 Tax=Vibrio rumoiensis 1S-45 TaxID=1188252 RepID=A0A1E5E663_9VIBR|nr:DUF481 domain-containing protein [Vibrio rumoiensis]OEF29182.1 hypothetical protein A1QC_04465 [Vibrio rumoiensis 1S-45]